MIKFKRIKRLENKRENKIYPRFFDEINVLFNTYGLKEEVNYYFDNIILDKLYIIFKEDIELNLNLLNDLRKIKGEYVLTVLNGDLCIVFDYNN